MIISDSTYNIAKENLREYINSKCIERRSTDIIPGKLPNTYYRWMFYLRRGLFNVDFNNELGKMFIYKFERIDPTFNFQLTGLETAATPMLASIPLVCRQYGIDINAFVVRKAKKEYGLRNWIEGLPNEKPVVLLDDLCNSSRSLENCRKILINEIPNIKFTNHTFTVVNKSNKHVHVNRLDKDMYLPTEFMSVSLFLLDDFNLSGPSH